MTMFVINARPLSDAIDPRTVRIREQSSAVRQTLSRLERILQKVETASIRRSEKAEKALAQLNDDTYQLYAELALEESEWSE